VLVVREWMKALGYTPSGNTLVEVLNSLSAQIRDYEDEKWQAGESWKETYTHYTKQGDWKSDQR
jgi:hypothetical protein